jgi:hypothetical protein
MSLQKYIAEAEHRHDHPDVGDTFAIELEDGTLLETYILAMKENAILLDATDRIVSVLNEWQYISDQAGEVLLEGVAEDHAEEQELEECGDYNDEESVSDQDRGEYDYEGAMAKDDLHTIVRAARRLNGMLDDDENMPEWVQSKINKAADYVDTAADYIESNKEQGMAEGEMDEVRIGPYELTGRRVQDKTIPEKDLAVIDDLWKQAWKALGVMQTDPQGQGQSAAKIVRDAMLKIRNIIGLKSGIMLDPQLAESDMDEAKYQGREVALGKPTRGDVKKFKVYVRDPKTGNVKKVNFGHGGTSAKRAGQKTMKIKKSNPARRRSFRARHHCENPGPRTKARYWSCRAW